jgi:Domain of unknown function (DUF5666)
MNAIPYEQRDKEWEPSDAQQHDERLPRRPRRQFFNKRSAALIAVIACAAGFYAGIRVQKGQTTGSASGGSSLAAAIAAGRGASGSGGSSGLAASSGSASAGAAGAPGGGAGSATGAAARPGALFAGGGLGGAAAGDASFGAISSVNGRSLYVTTAGGNVVKVKLSSATQISKSLTVKRSALHPGDTVVIRGLTNPKGTMTASSVSDSGAGARGGAGGSGESGGSGSSGGGSGASGAGASSNGGGGGSGASASSAVGSLFSSGGSGG